MSLPYAGQLGGTREYVIAPTTMSRMPSVAHSTFVQRQDESLDRGPGEIQVWSPRRPSPARSRSATRKSASAWATLRVRYMYCVYYPSRIREDIW
jgi:hypothetical protein